uniref:Uncharacterized protein n=1 Tax=Populus trichocarpa TaxID=3694 RepID=A0A3N7G3N8_POPTR|eukprot:XP_024444545.1 uncharacterized protein LOC112324694 isoform X4 [Populus trichocarpa]
MFRNLTFHSERWEQNSRRKNWAGRCDTRKQNCDTLHFLRCCKLRVSRKSFLELKLLKKGKPGVKIYRKLYAEEKEVSNGVLAICVSKLAAQPYLSLASILFGLSYGGVQSQLGTAVIRERIVLYKGNNFLLAGLNIHVAFRPPK